MHITGTITEVTPEGPFVGVSMTDSEGSSHFFWGEFRLTCEAILALMADQEATSPIGLEVEAEADGMMLYSLAAA